MLNFKVKSQIIKSITFRKYRIPHGDVIINLEHLPLVSMYYVSSNELQYHLKVICAWATFDILFTSSKTLGLFSVGLFHVVIQSALPLLFLGPVSSSLSKVPQDARVETPPCASSEVNKQSKWNNEQNGLYLNDKKIVLFHSRCKYSVLTSSDSSPGFGLWSLWRREASWKLDRVPWESPEGACWSWNHGHRLASCPEGHIPHSLALNSSPRQACRTWDVKSNRPTTFELKSSQS